MKTDTLILVGAGAIAAALVLAPRAARAAASLATGARVGRGDGASVYSDAQTLAYREQLRRELDGSPGFFI